MNRIKMIAETMPIIPPNETSPLSVGTVRSIGYTLRSRELCDLFTECRRHEVNKKHSPEIEVYNMLLLWGIITKQRFAALETHSN